MSNCEEQRNPDIFCGRHSLSPQQIFKAQVDRVINLLGADHHGHAARMKCALKAFDIDPDKLDIVIFQLVRLYRNGEIARMSKRTGRQYPWTIFWRKSEEMPQDSSLTRKLQEATWTLIWTLQLKNQTKIRYIMFSMLTPEAAAC